MYVVWWTEHFRDGMEDGGKVVGSIDAALELVNRMTDRTTTCRVFELGKEVAVVPETVEEPQPPKQIVKFRVKS